MHPAYQPGKKERPDRKGGLKSPGKVRLVSLLGVCTSTGGVEDRNSENAPSKRWLTRNPSY
jgi:hypothetical protein